MTSLGESVDRAVTGESVSITRRSGHWTSPTQTYFISV